MSPEGVDYLRQRKQHLSGIPVTVSVTLTRPADTTQYAAGDQVAAATANPAALAFTGAAPVNGGGGVIMTATCIGFANQTTKPNQRLYLFDGSPTPNGDNVNWNPGSADMANLIPGGLIDFSVWEVGGTSAGTAGNIASIQRSLNIPFRCGATTTTIWGEIVERGTYTPVSSESWTIRLGIAQ